MARLVTETDRAIIRLLQQNARVSYAELSRATGIPESTVRRRMDRLQQRGVIEFTMLADPSRLGYDLQAMIGLKVDLARLDQIAAALRAMDEVLFAAFVTGGFDLLLQVVVRSQADLVAFLTRRLAAVDGVRSTETFLMPHVVKPTTAWLLPEPDPTALAAEAQAQAQTQTTAIDPDDPDPDPDLTRPARRRREGRPRRGN